MSPLKVFLRGYSMAQGEDGQVIKSVHQAKIGENMKLSFSDGQLLAVVTGKEEAPNESAE